MNLHLEPNISLPWCQNPQVSLEKSFASHFYAFATAIGESLLASNLGHRPPSASAKQLQSTRGSVHTVLRGKFALLAVLIPSYT
jgi:hypothetical protein